MQHVPGFLKHKNGPETLLECYSPTYRQAHSTALVKAFRCKDCKHLNLCISRF
jgi:hypothetical protein